MELKNYLKKNIIKFDYFFIILIIFIISRLLFYFLFNIKFDYNFINFSQQTLDLNLLKNDLVNSILYLHHQPPLFNFFIGIILKLSGTNELLISNLLYLFISFLTLIVFYLTSKELNFDKKISLIFTIIFLFSSSLIGFENHFFYTLPTLFLLMTTFYYFLLLIKYKKNRYIFFFFIFLSLLSLLRSNFNIIFLFIFFLVLNIFYIKNYKLRIVCFLPILIVLLFYLKNFYYFGNFNISSYYLWENLIQKYYHYYKIHKTNSPQLINNYVLNVNEYNELKNKLSPIHTLPMNSDINILLEKNINYKLFNREVTDSFTKNGNINNWNHSIYISAKQFRKSDFLETFKFKPDIFVISYIDGLNYFFKSPTDYGFLNIKERLPILDNLYRILLYGNFGNLINIKNQNLFIYKILSSIKNFSFITFIIYFYVFIIFIKNILNFNKIKFIDLNLKAIFYFNCLIFPIIFISIFITSWELMRFRFIFDPIFYLFFIYYILRK